MFKRFKKSQVNTENEQAISTALEATAKLLNENLSELEMYCLSLKENVV